MMHRNRSVDVHKFAMVPRADIPRASFRMQKAHKTTFNAGELIPIVCEEILPGDTFNLKMTAFARLSTPIFPIMDNMYLDSFFFFVPNRLVWTNWIRFMGEQDNPTDSISFVVPTVESPEDGFDNSSIFDYFGLPCFGQTSAGLTIEVNALPFRAYNLIYNEWFRDENLQTGLTVTKADTGDVYTDFNIMRRGKRHDYFTSCLPWPQKGGVAVALPLGTTAPVIIGAEHTTGTQANSVTFRRSLTGAQGSGQVTVDNGQMFDTGSSPTGANLIYPSNLYADLADATAATINDLRTSFQIQRLLERDARGGTRYTEIIRAHFGVLSPDARLQRPEYLGGGSTALIINPVVQSSATTLTGGDTPLGTLAAVGTALANRHGFTKSFTEHGFVIGMVCVRADLTYQQGIRKMWSRSTRYDYYFPAFANLGEQAVLTRELYSTGNPTIDDDVFGYQERWAEYRYSPSQISGDFKSYVSGTLDAWHLAQNFTAQPLLGNEFIVENPPMARILAAGNNAPHFIFDSFIDIQAARPMPLYSVPGLIDHF